MDISNITAKANELLLSVDVDGWVNTLVLPTEELSPSEKIYGFGNHGSNSMGSIKADVSMSNKSARIWRAFSIGSSNKDVISNAKLTVYYRQDNSILM